MRSRMETNRARRKIRWTRLFLVLFVLLVMVTAMAGAAFYAYLNMSDGPVTSGTVATDGKAGEKLTKRINILILGVDDGDNETPGAPKRSDTMIVASINPQDATINLLSIPRDTRVTIPGRKGFDKITHAFAYGGAELSVRTVQEFLGIPINYYVVMDWQGFVKIVDILGGVDLYVESNMNYTDPYANLNIDLSKGFQHLNGEQAGQYVRFRHDELGDIGRVQRQQRFMKALSDEMFKFGTIFKLPALTTTLRQYVSTDMPGFTMFKLANTLKGMKDGSGFHAELLPGKFATVDGLSYWVPDKDQTKKLVDALFVGKDGTRITGNIPGQERSN